MLILSTGRKPSSVSRDFCEQFRICFLECPCLMQYNFLLQKPASDFCCTTWCPERVRISTVTSTVLQLACEDYMTLCMYDRSVLLFLFSSGDSYPGRKPVEIFTNDLNFPVSFHFYSAPKCCHALWGTQMITHFTLRGLYYVSDLSMQISGSFSVTETYQRRLCRLIRRRSICGARGNVS